MKSKNIRGTSVYKLYTGTQQLQAYYYDSQVKPFLSLLKKDHKNRLTLNLNQVRQLHGNDAIKQLYDQHKKAPAAATARANIHSSKTVQPVSAAH